MLQKEYWIEKLNLSKHPEGGYFRQTYISDAFWEGTSGNRRALCTSIYFLLTTTSPSHFHRLTSDEMWYYHAGAPLTIHMIHPDGRYESVDMGHGPDEHLQYLVPKGVIFGSSVKERDHAPDYSVVGCMVSPAFDFADFKLFTKDELLALYPRHAEIIEKMALDALPE